VIFASGAKGKGLFLSAVMSPVFQASRKILSRTVQVQLACLPDYTFAPGINSWKLFPRLPFGSAQSKMIIDNGNIPYSVYDWLFLIRRVPILSFLPDFSLNPFDL